MVDLKSLEKLLMGYAPDAYHKPIHDDFLQYVDNKGISIFQAIDTMKAVWGANEATREQKAVFARGVVIGMMFAAATEDPIFQEILKNTLERMARQKGENVADFMQARIKKGR